MQAGLESVGAELGIGEVVSVLSRRCGWLRSCDPAFVVLVAGYWLLWSVAALSLE